MSKNKVKNQENALMGEENTWLGDNRCDGVCDKTLNLLNKHVLIWSETFSLVCYLFSEDICVQRGSKHIKHVI